MENQFSSNKNHLVERIEKETSLNQLCIVDISSEVSRQLSIYINEINQQVNWCHSEKVSFKASNETLTKSIAKTSKKRKQQNTTKHKT